MPSDALTADEYLRGRLDIVLGLERIGFLARREPTIFDRETFTLQKIERLQTIRANMARHDHPMDNGGFRGSAGLRWRCIGDFSHGRFPVGK